MTTALTTATGNPIRHYAQSLPPHESDRHRAWIGVRVEALLVDYWRPNVSDAVRKEAIKDWMAALEEFTPDEITAACREWQNTKPETKPRTGNIRALIMAERAKLYREWKAQQPPPPEPELRAISEDRRRELEGLVQETIGKLQEKMRVNYGSH